MGGLPRRGRRSRSAGHIHVHLSDETLIDQHGVVRIEHGPLTPTEHRAKTLGGWQARQPDLGTYLWRSPDGLIAVTTNQGTLLLGDRHWAHQVWNTASDRSEGRS
jgi:hypothetical protein